eukprot:CAMPEP_0119016258 /NCGR_PEP_ID=MMETSP1176-20130426/11898_1 /TAXON_ID=265551 /ORGANISM="Synedropsis recta cf, Strain CCMP1620" /LENGTH=377 /DNA_ID=CAMNT_0006969599 /DNA_START=95 /DNA_END=1225 /DNA_ORIENTATION=+
MTSLRSKLKLGKNTGASAEDSAPKRTGRFSFRGRSSKSQSNTESGDCTDKKNKKSLRWKASLTRLINASDWDKIRDLLNDADAVDAEKWIRDSTDFMGQTALHYALRARAPIDVVCLLIDSTSSSFERLCDCSGRTPLHVAAGWGSGADVVARLLHGGPAKVSDLVNAKDFDGRTALHLACLSTASQITSSLPRRAKKKNANQDDDFLENRREVVRVLLGACSTVMTTADNLGKIALDYAIENGDDLHLMCNLRGSTKKVGLEKKNSHRPDLANKMGVLRSSQTYGYSRSTYNKATSSFQRRLDPSQALKSRRNLLPIDCPAADQHVGSSDEQEEVPSRSAASDVNAIPREILCPPNWKDDISAITQPRGLEPRKVV